jgi:hypothetical protein
MNSIGEVFEHPRFSKTNAALIRCTHVESGANRDWLKKHKTGIWNQSAREDWLQTIIVLIDTDDVKTSGIVEIWAGRFARFQASRRDAPKGFYHVDYFELVGVTKKKGLRQFCSGYCAGPNSGLVYLEDYRTRTLGENSPDVKSIVDDFRAEYSGEKDVVQPGIYTADCVHGRVVTALFERLKAQNPLRRFNNRNRFDLLMEEPDGMRTLFEVKTRHDTQSVYTGVGQLSMYNLIARAQKRALVLPKGGHIWRHRLKDVGTDLWTYSGEGASFESPEHKYR